MVQFVLSLCRFTVLEGVWKLFAVGTVYRAIISYIRSSYIWNCISAQIRGKLYARKFEILPTLIKSPTYLSELALNVFQHLTDGQACLRRINYCLLQKKNKQVSFYIKIIQSYACLTKDLIDGGCNCCGIHPQELLIRFWQQDIILKWLFQLHIAVK